MINEQNTDLAPFSTEVIYILAYNFTV